MLHMKVVFAAEMRRRLPLDGSIAVFACHPGECTTDIVRTLPALLQRLYNLLLPPLLISADRGQHMCSCHYACVYTSLASANSHELFCICSFNLHSSKPCTCVQAESCKHAFWRWGASHLHLYCAGGSSSLFCATSNPITAKLRHLDPEACYIGCGCNIESPAAYSTNPGEGNWLWNWSSRIVNLEPEAQLRRH